MKERPILFSGPMVRAILDGRKTQTRRVVKDAGLDCCGPCGNTATGDVHFAARDSVGNSVLLKCPYGQPEDRLWVRETWCVGNIFNHLAPRKLYQPTDEDLLAVDYAANDYRVWSKESQGKWRSSIHMPRWASRLTLEIVSVRVERLKDISEEDAWAEGLAPKEWNCGRVGYSKLWKSINGADSWASNPWVWVIEFKKL